MKQVATNHSIHQDNNRNFMDKKFNERRQSNEILPKNRHKLTIKVLTTHGSRTECGLTEVDVFDSLGERITMIQEVKVFNSPLDNKGTIMRLCDGYTQTKDENHMWWCNLPIND